MALEFAKRAIKTKQEKPGTKNTCVIGAIKVTNGRKTRRVTVYVGKTDKGCKISRSPRGLKPFTCRDALNSAMGDVITDIKRREKTFAYLSQISG